MVKITVANSFKNMNEVLDLKKVNEITDVSKLRGIINPLILSSLESKSPVKKLHQRISDLNEESLTLKSHLQSTLDTMSKIQSCSDQKFIEMKDSYKTQIAILKQKNSAALSQLEERNSQLSHLLYVSHEEVERLAERLACCKDEESRVKEMNIEYQKQIESLSDNLMTERENLEKSKKQLAECVKEKVELHSKLVFLEEEVEAVKVTISNFTLES